MPQAIARNGAGTRSARAAPVITTNNPCGDEITGLRGKPAALVLTSGATAPDPGSVSHRLIGNVLMMGSKSCFSPVCRRLSKENLRAAINL
jgi:hypothetical protein